MLGAPTATKQNKLECPVVYLSAEARTTASRAEPAEAAGV